MASSITSPRPARTTRHGSRKAGTVSNSREATPTAGKPGLAAVTKGETALDSVFKADMTNIRNLITCSICDQLLYEPWTLGCGHTYCYSCLCNWFVPNKRKKTCPECRTVVKQVPSPSFLVKQLVDIFIKRTELMPSDESIEQHQNKKIEETEDVERDRKSPAGLFKGSFPIRHPDLIFDNEDGVLRCPHCLVEYEGGATCNNCSQPVRVPNDGYDFSDIDDEFDHDLDHDIDAEDLEDLDNLEVDLDVPYHHHHHFGPLFGLPLPRFGLHHFHHHGHHPEGSITSTSEDSHLNDDSEDDEELDDDDSLNDFIERDDVAPLADCDPHDARNSRGPITISDDEDSDEGGAVRDRRPRRGGQAARNPRLSGRPVTVDISSSESGDLSEEAYMLRRAGWSPLNPETDSEVDGEVSEVGESVGESELANQVEYGYDDYDDDGDTETIGNRGSDDDDDRSRSELSQTPRSNYYNGRESIASGEDDEDPEDFEGGGHGILDRDGDTEMSASPGASRTSRSPSFNNEISYGAYEIGENLGPGAQVQNLGGESSDESIVPPAPRRRPRQQREGARLPRYDPRISMIFAEHQQSIRGAQDAHGGLAGLNDEPQSVVPASRTRRTGAYRHRSPTRRNDPLRSPRATSATRVISSSSRTARLPRQYQIRN